MWVLHSAESAAPVCCTIGSWATGTARAAYLFSYSSNEETHAACWRPAEELWFFMGHFVLLPTFSNFASETFPGELFSKTFPTLQFPMYFWFFFSKLNLFGSISSIYILSYFLVIARKFYIKNCDIEGEGGEFPSPELAHWISYKL